MNVTPQWLENKIKSLNEWMIECDITNQINHFEYAVKKQNRDYYVRKLIELEKNQLKTIIV